MSLIPTGTPRIGRSTAERTSGAVLSAPSASMVSQACTRSSTASMRASRACTISSGEACLVRTMRASSEAVTSHSSVAIRVRLLVQEIQRLAVHQLQPAADFGELALQLRRARLAVGGDGGLAQGFFETGHQLKRGKSVFPSR